MHKKVTKDRGLVYKYPRASIAIITGAALLVLWSKPIYDIFFDRSVDYTELRQELQREALKKRRD